MRRFERIVAWGIVVGIVAISSSSGILSEAKALWVRNQAFLDLSRGWSTVCLNDTISREQRVQLFDELKNLGRIWLPANNEEHPLVTAFVPWVVITDTRQIEAEDPRWDNSAGRNQLTQTHLVIYTKGGIKVPVLLGETSPVSIRVFGRHDAPPPVILSVSVDDILVGELSFENGDGTWGSEILTTTLVGGCHWLSIWYANDFFDKEHQLDRNAYIDWLAVEKGD